MKKNDINKFIVKQDSLIIDVIKSIQLTGLRSVVVVDNNDKVIGIISEGDILRSIIDGINQHAPVQSIVNVSFKYLQVSDINKSYTYFRQGIDIVPIISSDFHLIDIITIFDLLDSLIKT